MRKIWNRKDKDKRKSVSHDTNSPNIYSNHHFDSNEHLPTQSHQQGSDQYSDHNQNHNHNHHRNHQHQHHHLVHTESHEDTTSFDYEDMASIHEQPYSLSDKQSTTNTSTLSSTTAASTLATLNNTQPHTYTSTSTSIRGVGATGNSGSGGGGGGTTKKLNSPQFQSPVAPNVKLNSLIKHDHDTTVGKHSWVNGVFNGTEINENNLKLYRAELKGSHLYLYKAPTNLNVKKFRLQEPPIPKEVEAMMKNNNDSSSSIHNFNNSSTSLANSNSINENVVADPPQHNNDNATIETNASTLIDTKPLDVSQISSPIVQNTPTAHPPPLGMRKNSTIETTTIPVNRNVFHTPYSSSIPNTPVTAPPTLPITSSIDISEHNITYYKVEVPHPDLLYDFDTHRFSAPFFKDGKNSLEAIFHFLLFNQDPLDTRTINTIVDVLPVLPDFGKIMKFFSLYVHTIFEKKFEGMTNLELVVSRILQVLQNLEEHFDGFLLKSDIAPYILKVLEMINHYNIEDITIFKNKMLQKQQVLIDLLNNDNLPLNVQPFQDLNSTVFMKEINLIDFAYTISEIDLKFFSNWNSNIDKSLLLYSSISDDTNRDFFYKKNPLIFNNDYHIHYLSRLLVNHLFVENSSMNMSSANLENKARLLEKWIDLGCLLDKSGNMSSWLGISSVILSQPVLRLTKIWSLVAPDYIRLLKSDWSPVLFELDRRYLVNESTIDHGKSTHLGGNEESRDLSTKDSYHIMAPRGLGKIYPKERVIPFFGDLVINNSGNTTDKSVDIYELESIWKRVNYSFDRWNDYLTNLTNYDEIIKYNDDVLRRYDSMGFIFSNESLNQVLFLGANNSDERQLENPPSPIKRREVNNDIKNKLLRLIELNCDSINMEKIMKLSINLEPELPEAYLDATTSISVAPSTLQESTLLKSNINRSNLSVNSIDSSGSLNETPLSESNPASRIPSFNNKFFKIDLGKYDELMKSGDKKDSPPLDPSVNKHNFVIDNELTFRIDDFISELDNSSTSSVTGGGAVGAGGGYDDFAGGDDDDDVPGLGIDVDDILNSDKFTNFLMSPKANNSKSNKRKLSMDGSMKKIYKFIPKYATVDRLIDLLLLDSKYFHRDVHLDLTEYRFVFLLNYNSFMTTKELLDKLAHRFINSGNAVISVMKKNYLLKKLNHESDKTKMEPNFNQGNPQLAMNFPNWNLDTAVDLNELGDVDYELLLKIQINILKVLIVLINNFYSNFSLDLANKNILIKLLKLFSNEILQWYNSNKIDNTLEKSFESLVTYYKKLKKLFVKKTYRPVEVLKFDEYLISEFRFNNSLHEVPMNRNLPSHRNVHKIEKFLYKFNKLLAVFYKGIKTEDWVRVYKILENSFEKNALLDFSLQKPTVLDDQLIISNIFNFFESLVIPDERQLLLKKFPLVFRKLFKVYFKFKSYLLVQLTDLNITTDERLDRMKTLLIMAKVSKLKMSDNQFIFEGSGNIPSCIETAIINVIYSPESRKFSNLWVRAAQTLTHREGNFDSVELLLPPNITINDLQSTEPLLPCFGWIIENLIETDKCPSYFKNQINFNKRYLIYKLIRELSVEDFEGESGSNDFTFNESREFDFLLKLDESLVNQQNLREFSPVDKAEIFQRIMKDQHQILVVDNQKKHIRDSKRLIKGTNNLSIRSATNSSFSNVHSGISASTSNTTTAASNTNNNNNNNNFNNNNNNNNNALSGMHNLTRKTSNTSLKRQSLSYKSSSSSRFKISGLFTKSRPFSLTGNTSTPERVVNIEELPNPEDSIEPKQKPVVVIPLKNRKIFPVYLMPLCFKIDSETTNDHYFFQATNDTDLNEWLIKLNYANRHWFYSRILNNKTTNNNLVFGVPISFICVRELSVVPKFLEAIFQEIESEGIKDVGIYRISSSISELTSIKQTIDRTGTINFNDRGYDTHALTSIVKSYFRELPDSLITDDAISQFYELKLEQENKNQTPDRDAFDLNAYQKILHSLPVVNFNTLKILVKHLNKISEHKEVNKMTPSNIATVIGPALTESSNLDILINNFGFMNLVLEKLINNYHEVFDDREDEKKDIESDLNHAQGQNSETEIESQQQEQQQNHQYEQEPEHEHHIQIQVKPECEPQREPQREQEREHERQQEREHELEREQENKHEQKQKQEYDFGIKHQHEHVDVKVDLKLGERQYQQQQQLGLGQDNNNTPRKNNVIQSGVDSNDDGVHHLTKVVSDDTTRTDKTVTKPNQNFIGQGFGKEEELKVQF